MLPPPIVGQRKSNTYEATPQNMVKERSSSSKFLTTCRKKTLEILEQHVQVA